MESVLGVSTCALSVAGIDTFIVQSAIAVRAAQSQGTGIRTGAGALISETAYWTGWHTNALSSLDFFGWDIYPETQNRIGGVCFPPGYFYPVYQHGTGFGKTGGSQRVERSALFSSYESRY